MAQSREESVSPGTRITDSELPRNTAAKGSPALRLSNLRTELDQDGTSGFQAVNGKSTREESVDYLNNGIAHQDHSPHTSNPIATSSPLRHSNLKQSFEPAGTAFPFEAAGPPAGTTTPPGRRSVQFVRTEGPRVEQPGPGHARQDSWGEDSETPGKDRRHGQSLISKLKALASTSGLQTHIRSQSTPANTTEEGTGSAPLTPAADRTARFPPTLQEEDSDADAEETADEAPPSGRLKTKRRFRRPAFTASGSQTVPNTPRTKNAFPAESPGGTRAIFSLPRRGTDGSLDQRGHYSEGEGRDRLGATRTWRRGSSWIAGRSSGVGGSQDVEGTPSFRRPSNFRRALTGINGGQSDGDGPGQKRPHPGSERRTTLGAAQWRKLKSSLKAFSRKDEHKVDYMKSAELMAELRAGAPAVLMLASMIQRDEHGNKRIPVLLEQLKLRVVDSSLIDNEPAETDNHSFRIELEYGSGSNRMKWVIHRSLRDFANLHIRYKLQGRSDKYIQLRGDSSSRPKQPRFPRSAFPWLMGFGGLGDTSDEEGPDPIRADDTVGEGTNSETERRKQKKRRPSFSRRKSSVAVQDPTTGQMVGFDGKNLQLEKARKKLELYMQEMIRWLIFRADSNRLCRFLELSALGVRLAAEGGYHGKEGYLVIQSAKGLDVRRMLTPDLVWKRHSPKWFLVRHSYVVCVDSPENMNIYDVYLADSAFTIQSKRRHFKELGGRELLESTKIAVKNPQHHTLKIENAERKVKLIAKNERQRRQFEDSLKHMLKNTAWSKPNRFGSFAPVRTDCYAQWLVDGRDYMWNVSRAIEMAKDVVYIHDWWLSPHIYLRRPAAISQKWRLDRLLKRKAEQGVKIFIILYRNVEAAVPIDSELSKFSMLDLHPNVFVQRSPNQFKKNQFFFAHHEKICVVDHMIAFVGGIDLCFGRWDSPDHSVTDDKPTGFEQNDLPKDKDHCQMWPGKDYSNPRVQDFFKLNEPYAEMYDRSKTPRMPWHDISMQVVGQPARDLTRHFIQRWNYVLRGRKPTRPTPFLLPPPDYQPKELEELGITGTCEVQILRSASDWSTGLVNTEHSIMTAYCKMIEESEHFVYMENQFFITSCETMNVKIVNKIGDAIVERAIRAYKNNEGWRCIILIPLVPGFQNTVDEAEGTSVRLIMQCQFRSICRGEGSIFGRLRAVGIVPEDFIQFFSLRSWGRIGPRKMLVTEQLYIHAKVIIVDDRVALIGSANINERSMLGSRDSETAAIVRDRDMIHSTMDGKPYQVGRFAHTLRMRLMREHLGLDTDDIMEKERQAELDREQDEESESSAAEHPSSVPAIPTDNESVAAHELVRSFNHDIDWEEGDNPNVKPDRFKSLTTDKRVIGNSKYAADVVGDGVDRWKVATKSGQDIGRDSIIVDGGREVLVTGHDAEGKGTVSSPQKPHKRAHLAGIYQDGIDDEGPGNNNLPPIPELPRRTTEQLGLIQLSQLPALPLMDDTDIGGPTIHLDHTGKPIQKAFTEYTVDIERVSLDQDCMRDPLNDSFFDDTWVKIAENNTKIFRRVFRCNPDSEVTTWEQYTEYAAYGARFAQAQGGKSSDREEPEHPARTGPPGAAMVSNFGAANKGLSSISEKVSPHNENRPMGTVSEWAEEANQEHDRRLDTSNVNLATTNSQADGSDEKSGPGAASENVNNEKAVPLDSNPLETDLEISPANSRKATVSSTGGPPSALNQGSVRRRRGTTRASQHPFSASDDLMSQQDADELLGMVQGHLVVFPYEWLVKEELNSGWLYPVDQVAPLSIYD